MPYFPLESGLLTGKYRSGEPLPEGSRLAGWKPEQASRFINDERLHTVSVLGDWTEQHGHTLLDLAMSWLLVKQQVASVICGATSPAQVAANVSAAGWSLTGEELDALNEVLD